MTGGARKFRITKTTTVQVSIWWSVLWIICSCMSWFNFLVFQNTSTSTCEEKAFELNIEFHQELQMEKFQLVKIFWLFPACQVKAENHTVVCGWKAIQHLCMHKPHSPGCNLTHTRCRQPILLSNVTRPKNSRFAVAYHHIRASMLNTLLIFALKHGEK